MKKADRVLTYRLGSLGDTIIALPCFHRIAAVFPNAERRVLTNFPVSGKAAPIASILGDSGLVHSYMHYPLGTRDPQELLKLHKTIRTWKPDVLVYLLEPRGFVSLLRDYLFFLSCRIPNIIGFPFRKSLRQHPWRPKRQQYGYEAERLIKCLEPIGAPDLQAQHNWNLLLTEAEMTKARRVLAEANGLAKFFVCGIGTKMQANDWGVENWKILLGQAQKCHPDLGVVFVGATEEWETVEEIRSVVRLPSLNLCGKLTPRESWGVLRFANFFLGVDSGPMHLATSAGIPCVAIFSARNKPGVWFPYGNQHRVLYYQTDCYNCQLEVCVEERKKCIASVTVENVLREVKTIISDARRYVPQLGNRIF